MSTHTQIPDQSFEMHLHEESGRYFLRMHLFGFFSWQCEVAAGNGGKTAELQPIQSDLVTKMLMGKANYLTPYAVVVKRLVNGCFWGSLKVLTVRSQCLS